MTRSKKPEPESERVRASALGMLQDARVGRLALGNEEVFVISVPLSPRRMIETLTAAEAEIVELIWRGRSTAQIAAVRGSSRRTVDNQLSAIYEKAGVTTRQELVALLVGSGPSSEPPK